MLAFDPQTLSDAADSSPCDVVLVVDDSDVIASLITCILDRRGYRVVRARDGSEGERIFDEREDEIALAVLDYRLPDTDGVALSRRLRAKVSALPVLFTSGHTCGETDALSEAPTAFLAKPFLPAQLCAQIDELVGVLA